MESYITRKMKALVPNAASFFVLNTNPRFCIHKSFVITDLHVFSAISIIMDKNTMNTVVGFNIVNDLKAERLEIRINVFIRPNIQWV